MISETFGRDIGTLGRGSAADLVVVDYDSPTPITAKNFSDHFLFGMRAGSVESVMVGGKWVVKDRQVVGVDVPKAYEKAARSAKRLWERIAKA